jgi:hypothetical protein
MAVNGPTELSSRPERSAVEGPAVSLPVLTQILEPLKYVLCIKGQVTWDKKKTIRKRRT